MTNEPSLPTKPRRRAGALAALALALVAGAGVLYGIYGQARKETAPGACAAAASLTQELAPLARGEVAALSVARRPREATTLTLLSVSASTSVFLPASPSALKLISKFWRRPPFQVCPRLSAII
jgi:hypothetical protein